MSLDTNARDLGPERVREVAYHEAGHAVAYAALGLNPGRVTIDTDADDQYLGRAGHQDFSIHRLFADVTAPHDAHAPEAPPQPGPPEGDHLAWLVFVGLRRSALAALAGPLAGYRVKREHEPGWTWADEWDMCAAETEDGDDWALVDEALSRIDGTPAQVAALAERWRAEVDDLLTERWAAVERVATALIERGTVSGDEVDDLVWGDEGTNT